MMVLVSIANLARQEYTVGLLPSLWRAQEMPQQAEFIFPFEREQRRQYLLNPRTNKELENERTVNHECILKGWLE